MCADIYRVWTANHVLRGANEAAHHLTRWATTEFSLGGNSRNYEHFLNLPWLFVGTNPPQSAFVWF